MVRRQSSFELLRIISAAGIVWFHAKVTGSEIGYTGLAIFLILTPYFELGANFERLTPWIQHAKRLLIPFLFWSIIFAAANLIKGKPVLNLAHGPLLAVLAGPSIHLWYLPFMAAALAITGALKAHFTRRAIAIAGLVILLPLAIAFPLLRAAGPMLVPPVGQWFHALTPLLAGIIFGASRGSLPTIPALGAVMLAASMIVFGEIAILQFLVGLGLVELASRFSWTNARVNAYSGYMMGVYLVHPLALTVLRPLERYSQAAFVLCAVVASTLAVMMATRVAPTLAELLLGAPRRREVRPIAADISVTGAA